MMRTFKNLCRWILPPLIVSCGLSLAMAQSGPDNMIALPINAIDGMTIQLRSGDGKTFTFKVDAETVYCKGENKLSDWTYLKEKVGKEGNVTLKLSKDYIKRDVAQNHQFKYLLVFETVVIRGHATPGQIRQPRDPSPCDDSRDRRAPHIFRGCRPGKFPVANEGPELKHRYSNFSLRLHEKPRLMLSST